MNSEVDTAVSETTEEDKNESEAAACSSESWWVRMLQSHRGYEVFSTLKEEEKNRRLFSGG